MCGSVSAENYFLNFEDNARRYFMEALGILGFVFGMMGIVALVRLEKLIKTLKSKGILE